MSVFKCGDISHDGAQVLSIQSDINHKFKYYGMHDKWQGKSLSSGINVLTVSGIVMPGNEKEFETKYLNFFRASKMFQRKAKYFQIILETLEVRGYLVSLSMQETEKQKTLFTMKIISTQSVEYTAPGKAVPITIDYSNKDRTRIEWLLPANKKDTQDASIGTVVSNYKERYQTIRINDKIKLNTSGMHVPRYSVEYFVRHTSQHPPKGAYLSFFVKGYSISGKVENVRTVIKKDHERITVSLAGKRIYGEDK